MKVVHSFMPAPRIIERYPLSAADEGVVEPLGVEWRVEIDQIDRLIVDILAHDVEAVAKIKAVGHARAPESSPFSAIRSL